MKTISLGSLRRKSITQRMSIQWISKRYQRRMPQLIGLGVKPKTLLMNRDRSISMIHKLLRYYQTIIIIVPCLEVLDYGSFIWIYVFVLTVQRRCQVQDNISSTSFRVRILLTCKIEISNLYLYLYQRLKGIFPT